MLRHSSPPLRPSSPAVPQRRRRHRQIRPTVEGLESRLVLATSPLDPTFGAGGIVLGALDTGSGTTLSDASAVAVQPDGKVVVAGTVARRGPSSPINSSVLAVRRYNANGSVDTSFGTNGETDFPIAAIATVTVGVATPPANVAIQPDGKIVLAGVVQFVPVDLVTEPTFQTYVFRVGADGQLDTAFGTDGATTITTQDARLDSVGLLGDGSIVVAGMANPASGTPQVAIARFTPAGTLDTSFGTAGLTLLGAGTGGAVAVSATDQIYITRNIQVESPLPPFTPFTAGYLSRLRADGTFDDTFGTNGSALSGVTNLTSLALAPDGRIAVAGGQTVGSQATAQVSLLRPDGTLDPTFTSVPSLDARAANQAPGTYVAVAVQSDGKVLATSINYAFPQATARVDRFLASGPPDATYGVGGSVTVQVTSSTAPNQPSQGDTLNAAALALTADDRLVLGGTAIVFSRGTTTPTFVGTQAFLVRLLPDAGPQGASGDYDGDGRSDLAAILTTFVTFAYRPSNGSADVLVPFGVGGTGQTLPAPGDYDGDGRTDIAGYLPAYGVLAYRPSTGGPDVIVPFGVPGAGQSIPAPGDYDGDGRTDLAAYLPGFGVLAYRPSSGGPDVLTPFGTPGPNASIPAPGDYDGDGRTDLAVFLTGPAILGYRPSSGGPDVLQQFGFAGTAQTIPAPGDYDGDGRTDVAAYLPGPGVFAYRPSGGAPDVLQQFGFAGVGLSIVAPGDYDGDGKTDVAVFIPPLALFAVRPSAGGADLVQQFGAAGTGQTIPASSIPYAQMTAITDAGTGTGGVAAAAVAVPLTDDVTATPVTIGRRRRRGPLA